MRLKNSDLLVTIGIAALNVVWALLPTHIPVVGIVLALPMIFFIPGYTLTEILGHKRVLDTLHRILLSLGLSIALDIISGFLLNVLPLGLRTLSWVLLLGCLTLLLTLIVLYLRRGVTRTAPIMQAPRIYFILRGSAVFSLAIILVVVTLIYATNGVTKQPHSGFTQLWMLPPTQASQNCVVHLGVRSFEVAPVSYHAVLSVNAVREVVWPSITLAPNQTWEQPILVPAVAPHPVAIDVKLYKGNSSTSVYRQVHVTLHFMSKNKASNVYQCM